MRDRSRSPSVNPLSSTASKDTTSWRDKLGTSERPAPRDTLDVEKPSESQRQAYAHAFVLFLERKERRDPPKFSEQLSDVTVFEGNAIRSMTICSCEKEMFE